MEGEADRKSHSPLCSLGLFLLALPLTFSPNPLKESCSDHPTWILGSPLPYIHPDDNPHHTLLNSLLLGLTPPENNVFEMVVGAQ